VTECRSETETPGRGVPATALPTPAAPTAPRASTAAASAAAASEVSVWDAAGADFAAYRAGDEAALDRLVHRLTPVLWHVVRAYRLDTATAEDVVQTTWFTLVRNAASVDDPRAVGRWLTVTARREAWRCSRASGREDRLPEEDLDRHESAAESPEGAAVREARDGALWAAVKQLSERCQRLVRLVAFVERPSYAEVSAQLGMPVGSIGPTRARCLIRLRELMVEAGWRPA
jgi:RNA polymerase sigma factor (sigma-70 family)